MNDLKLLYRSYEKEITDNVIALLEQNNISYKLNSANSHPNAVLGSDSSNQYEVYVKTEDFDESNLLISSILDDGDSEMNLNTYSNEEIKEILFNQDDWHTSFINSARKIAQERNITIDYESKSFNEPKIDTNDIDTTTQEAYKEARNILFIIAGINVIIPIILIGPGDGVKILNLLFYITGAIVYLSLGLLAKRMPLVASIIGLTLLLTVYFISFLGDPSTITRWVFLKISLIGGLSYAIYKGIQYRRFRSTLK